MHERCRVPIVKCTSSICRVKSQLPIHTRATHSPNHSLTSHEASNSHSKFNQFRSEHVWKAFNTALRYYSLLWYQCSVATSSFSFRTCVDKYLCKLTNFAGVCHCFTMKRFWYGFQAFIREKSDFKWVIRHLTPVNTLIYCLNDGVCVKIAHNSEDQTITFLIPNVLA